MAEKILSRLLKRLNVTLLRGYCSYSLSWCPLSVQSFSSIHIQSIASLLRNSTPSISSSIHFKLYLVFLPMTRVATPEALVSGRWTSSPISVTSPLASAVAAIASLSFASATLSCEFDLDALVWENTAAIKVVDGVLTRGAFGKSLPNRFKKSNHLQWKQNPFWFEDLEFYQTWRILCERPYGERLWDHLRRFGLTWRCY